MTDMLQSFEDRNKLGVWKQANKPTWFYGRVLHNSRSENAELDDSIGWIRAKKFWPA